MIEKKYIKIQSPRNNEYPIVRFWYTKHAGRTIEEIIDREPSFIEWAIKCFQNVTPAQAAYFEKKTGKAIPDICIQDVEPYEWVEGDTEQMYIDICKSQDLGGTLQKYRGVQLNLF